MAETRPRWESNGAREQLAVWRRSKGILTRDLAMLLDVAEHTIMQWQRGETRPKLSDSLVVEKLTGIDHRDWMTKEERAEMDTKMARVEDVLNSKPVRITFRERIASAL